MVLMDKDYMKKLLDPTGMIYNIFFYCFKNIMSKLLLLDS